MAAVKGISTPALAAAAVGALVIWSALKGASIGSGFRSLLGGKQPSGANTEPIQGAPITGAGFTGAPGTSSVIANQGLSYVGKGHVYQWGGGSPSGWDCSGFVNWVIGHDLSSPIPGSQSGNYSGHGPTTLQWAVFGQKVPAGQEQPGDLVVWPTQHMGIVTGNGQMVNCPGPNGTPAPIISGYNWGSHVFRRVGGLWLLRASGLEVSR